MTKKFKVTFEEGCFDELEDEMTQEELDALIDGIRQLAETGEIFENATPVNELPIEDQEEVMRMLGKKAKRTRH